MGENNQAALLLRKQLAELNKNPVEGFSAGLIDESDIFKWEVTDPSYLKFPDLSCQALWMLFWRLSIKVCIQNESFSLSRH